MLVMLVSLGAFAQASDSGAMAPAATASAPSSKEANRQLARDVRRALVKSKTVETSNIYVRARGGVIRLTGFVPESPMIQAATDAAKTVSGVTSVDNQLSVRQPGH